MSEGLILLPRAVDDIALATNWSDSKEHGLGTRFESAMRSCLESIEHFPESFPLVYRDVRQAMLKHFPYGTYFRIVDSTVFVHRVIHHSRHQRTWQRDFD